MNSATQLKVRVGFFGKTSVDPINLIQANLESNRISKDRDINIEHPRKSKDLETPPK